MRIWLEKTLVHNRSDRQEGEYSLGKSLWSPQTSSSGARIYANMENIKSRDIVFHLVDNERFSGISIANSEVDRSFICLPDTEWAGRPGFLIKLRDYEELEIPISRDDVLNKKNKSFLLDLLEKHKDLFYNRKLTLRQGGYLTVFPSELVDLLNTVYRNKTGKDLPHISQLERNMIIVRAAEQVLKELGKPSHYKKIYDKIIEEGLYKFGAVDPPKVVYSELRRYSINVDGGQWSSKVKLFYKEDDKPIFGLIKWRDRGDLDENKSLLESKKQIIFFGPPGTGKTYKAREFAVGFIKNGRDLK